MNQSIKVVITASLGTVIGLFIFEGIKYLKNKYLSLNVTTTV